MAKIKDIQLNVTVGLNVYRDRCLANSRNWFPFADLDDEIMHQALGVAGEAGEVVEHVKKAHRKALSGESELDFQEALAGRRTELGHEIVDTMIYLLNLAGTLGIDLDAAFEEKVAINRARWE